MSCELLRGAAEPGTVTVEIKGGVDLSLHGGAALSAVPGDPGTAQQLKKLPQGHIGGALLQIACDGHGPVVVMYVNRDGCAGAAEYRKAQGHGQHGGENT